MKKVKLFALLACLVFVLSAFAMACTTVKPSTDPESTPESEIVSTPESEPSTEPESEPSTEPESEPSSEPESEPTPDPVTYTATFMADGVEVEKVTYLETDTEITEPAVPAKDGYTGAWEEYVLGSDITVNAVYTAIVYTVHFDVDGVEDITFTVETIGQVEFPAVPAKDGYTAAWDITEDALTLADVTVNAVYTAIVYTVHFDVDGVEDITFTVETIGQVEFPAAPEKEGYQVTWSISEEDLGLEDVTVNAVYTAIVYTVHFDVDGVEDITFTVETIGQVEFPAAPEKDGYQVTWSISEEDLGLEDVTVTVVEERLFTIKFVGVEGYDDIVVPESQLDVNNIPAAPVKDGYVTGWEEPVLDAINATVTITYWEMTERDYYTRDVVGAEMVRVFAPISDANSIAWDETEKAYHFVNNNQVDDNRALTFDRNYINKLAELGLMGISFEVKLDANVAGEILYRGFYPGWWTTNWGVDFWAHSGAQDWIKINVDFAKVPVADDGALKTIFMLGDHGSGLWVRNVELYDPDFDNLTDRDFVNGFEVHHLASTNKVSWDETEGAILFTNNVTDQDNKRGFWMKKDFTDAIKARAASITFKVKFVGERAVVGADNSLYVINGVINPEEPIWFNWGSAQLVGYAESGWVDVVMPITEDLYRIALLCTSGSFYVKDIAFIAPEFIPEVDELTHENFAKMFTGLAAGSSVVWDETEGAFRFINAATAGDDSRAIILNPKFMAKLREVTDKLTFKVKFLNNSNPHGGDDRSLYVSYGETNANKWWGNHMGVGWQENTWVDVTTTFNADTSLTLILLNCTGDFLVKDFAIPQPATLTTVHEYEIAPTTAVVTGIRNNTVEEVTTVNDAPAGVNGSALKLAYTALYGGFALSFPEYTGAMQADYMLNFRIYIGSAQLSAALWFYNIEYAGAGGDHRDHVAENIVTNEWVDLLISPSNLPAFVNSQGKFVGFQVGLFADGISEFYIDSLSIVGMVNNNIAII